MATQHLETGVRPGARTAEIINANLNRQKALAFIAIFGPEGVWADHPEHPLPDKVRKQLDAKQHALIDMYN